MKAYKAAESLGGHSEDSAYALMQAGRCYFQLFDTANAIRCYQPFFKQYAASRWADDALMRAAVIYVGPLGDRKAGINAMETVVTRYPGSDQVDRALVQLATLAEWEQDWKRARGLYAALLQQCPNSGYRSYVEKVALPQLYKRMKAGNKVARVI